jgi:hypothetical protein
MDASQFDTLVRTWVTSRRTALTILLGGAAGTVALVRREEAAALPKPPGFERLGKRCDQGQPCGVYVPCTNGQFCAPSKCWINGELVDDRAINPDNPCQRCAALEHKRAWSRWSDVRDGTSCPPDAAGNPCLSTFIAHCQDGICVTEPLPDGTECGADQVCCSGVCSAAGACCPAEGQRGRRNRASQDCAPICHIDGTDYALGDLNPEFWCLWCDPAVSATAWSPTPPNRACDATGLTVCCDGGCCPPGLVCRESGGSLVCVG